MPNAKLISPVTKQGIQKIRVAAYCRVSSISADQQNSFANQVKFYTKEINKKPEWELVGVFADEGISGLKAENRPEFQRMIRMCEHHKIDLVVTKSVSRFARNVKEALEYVRRLKLLGVGIQFEKEGICTLSMADEMLLNTFSAIAQEESKAISQHQRLSIVKRMELGEFVDSNAPYGFRLVDKKLRIYEPEAEIVQQVFQDYLRGKSTAEIARELSDRGIPTKTGKDHWKSAGVAYILSNERYVGDSRFQKTFRDTTVPFRQHINRGQEDQFFATETHEGFIDRATFDAVQNLLNSRKSHFHKCEVLHIYPLTGRIRCSECGSSFHRKLQNGTVKWVCCKHEADYKSCPGSYYSEERIYDGFITMVNKLRFGEEDILGVVIAKLEQAVVEYKKHNTAARQISTNVAELNAKLLMLDQLRSKGYLDGTVYQSQAREIKKQLDVLKEERQDLFESSISEMMAQVKKLRSLVFELEEPLEYFPEKLFEEIVQGITVDRNDEMTMTLNGGLKFTEKI